MCDFRRYIQNIDNTILIFEDSPSIIENIQ